MIITSWNINGIRSLKVPIKDILHQLESDIVCFQETKISRNQVNESIAIVDDYSSFFAFPKYLSGYSGVATFCHNRVKPIVAQDDFTGNFLNGDCSTNDDQDDEYDSQFFSASEIKELDQEGRVLITQHKFTIDDNCQHNLFVFNVYCPRNDPDRPERALYKLNFHRLLEEKSRQILASNVNNHVLIIGDINISHKRIDHCDPDKDFEESPYRQWLDDFLTPSPVSSSSSSSVQSSHFIDIFRHRNPNAKNAFTCWNTRIGARKTNFGTRIDLALCDAKLSQFVKDFEILTHFEGSDHCPIKLVLGDIEPLPSLTLPRLCAKFWPELGEGKRQTSIKGFLQRDNNLGQQDLLPLSQKSSKQQAKRPQQASIKKYFKVGDGSRCSRNQSDHVEEDEAYQYDNGSSSQEKSSQEIAKLNELFGKINDSDDNACNDTTKEVKKRDDDAVKTWKKLLPGSVKTPLCSGHGEPSILLTVTKQGPTKGKQFYACAKPKGFKDNPASQCNFFKWYKI